MVRLWAAPALNQKSLISVALLVALIIAAFFLVRQMQHTAAVNVSGVHNSTTPVNTSPALPSESSAAEDSLNLPQSQASSTNTSHTRLNVNGQDIPLPANGSVNQTMTEGDTTTTVNAQTSTSSDGQGAARASNSTSVNVQVNSRSESRR